MPGLCGETAREAAVWDTFNAMPAKTDRKTPVASPSLYRSAGSDQFTACIKPEAARKRAVASPRPNSIGMTFIRTSASS